jgi:hypothetical protein
MAAASLELPVLSPPAPASALPLAVPAPANAALVVSGAGAVLPQLAPHHAGASAQLWCGARFDSRAQFCVSVRAHSAMCGRTAQLLAGKMSVRKIDRFDYRTLLRRQARVQNFSWKAKCQMSVGKGTRRPQPDSPPPPPYCPLGDHVALHLRAHQSSFERRNPAAARRAKRRWFGGARGDGRAMGGARIKKGRVSICGCGAAIYGPVPYVGDYAIVGG